MSQACSDELWEGLPFEGQLAELRKLRTVEASAEQSTTSPRAVLPVNPEEAPHAIIVIGAGGDLAKKKTFPALFRLYINGQLPKKFRIWGLDRLESDRCGSFARLYFCASSLAYHMCVVPQRCISRKAEWVPDSVCNGGGGSCG